MQIPEGWEYRSSPILDYYGQEITELDDNSKPTGQVLYEWVKFGDDFNFWVAEKEDGTLYVELCTMPRDIGEFISYIIKVFYTIGRLPTKEEVENADS
jgi:hypothetical protein